MKKKNTILTLISIIILGLTFACEDEENAPQLAGDFEADEQEILAGETVTFNDASTGSPSKWNWTFEGGSPATSVLSSPTVTYETPGTYTVKLMIGKAGDSVVVVKDEYITVGYGEVTADFSVNQTAILQGESIKFTDLSEGNPTAWSWEFIPSGGGDLITSDEQNPEITFPEPGVYTVKLTSSNPVSEHEKVKPELITVIDATYVEADFNADIRTTYSAGAVHFNDASLGTVETWNWTFEGGTPASSTEQNPTVTYNSAGQFKVTLVVSNEAASSTKEEVTYISIIPGDGLLAFIPFDGDGNDKGSLNLTVNDIGEGVSYNGVDRNSNTNTTAVFDGNGSLNISPAAEKQLGTSSYTVGVWMKSSQPSRMMIWQDGGGGAGLPTAWFRVNDNSTNQIFRFNINTGVVMNIGVADDALSLSDDTWHYVVCTRDVDAQTGNVYVDGQLIKSREGLDVRDVSNELGFHIGGQYSGPGEANNLFTGQLDDLVIYNRALSEAEIIQLSGF